MTLGEGFQGHQGEDAVEVLASAAAFDAAGGGAALSFAGAAGDLPALGAKRGIVESLTAFAQAERRAGRNVPSTAETRRDP